MRKQGFKTILILALILTGIGFFSIYSAAGKVYLEKQLIWFFISIAVFWLAYRAEKRVWLTLSPIFYIFVLFLLLSVLVLNRGDVKRWLTFGPVNIQPAEFAKVFTILLLARVLAQKKKFSFSFSSLSLPTLLIFLPSFLVFIQPDLGSALSFLAIFGFLIYFKGLKGYEIVLLFSPLFSCLFGLS
ncbi:MAG: FtsW/RodA/SpoVE family cell cycle protein, partial [candidate division WOR-3 bacterium]